MYPISYLVSESTHGVKIIIEYDKTYIPPKFVLSILLRLVCVIGVLTKWRQRSLMAKNCTVMKHGREFVVKTGVQEPRIIRKMKKYVGRRKTVLFLTYKFSYRGPNF